MNTKLIVTLFLVGPLAVVAGLAFMVDRDAARKNRAEMLQRYGTESASLAGSRADQASARPLATASAAELAQPAKQPAPAAAEPKMVQPETLEQGFVIVVKDEAGLASANSPIHLASSHNGWDPGDKNQVLTSRSDLRWQIVLPKPKLNAPLSFKFTRGNWDTCEVSADLADIENRSLPKVDISKLAPGEKPVIEFVVPKWADQRPSAAARPDLNPYYDIKATGTVRRLQVAGGGVATLRDVLVWLPEGYDNPANANQTYPVLYLQDGQNVFMQMPGTPAEWGADETATRLIAEAKIVPVIIVAIPHSGRTRVSEYSPVPVAEGVEARGDRYVYFLVTAVMPRVNRAFRTKTGPQNTAIGGASMGAAIALHAAVKHPELFGKVLLESLPLLNNDKALMRHFAAASAFPPVIYFAMGGKEAGDGPDNADANTRFREATEEFRTLATAKAKGADLNVQVILDNNGTHDEATWARRFPSALQMLFQRPVDWQPGN